MKKYLLVSVLFALLVILAACSDKKEEVTNTTATTDGDATEETSADAPEEVTIGYQIIPNAELLAKELGLVEEKFPDTEIKWVQFDSGRDVNTAMASGDIDLGLAGSVPVVTGIANNVPYYVYFIHDVIGEAESFVVREELEIDSFEDLKGTRLAVPFGSTTHFSLLKALDSKGISPNDVQILDLQPPDILAAWQRGDIDGAFVWHPTLGKIIADGGQVLTTAEELASEGIITADVGIAHKDFADQYPQFIADYKTVLDSAIAKYREDPQTAATTLAPALGVGVDEVLGQIDGLIWIDSTEQASADYLGTANSVGEFAAVLETTGQFLIDQKIIPSNPELGVFEQSIFYNQ